ncbi:hypothetical protein QL285_046739 [Trifolium repens]|nr:hypothetical protein QL285_046739 [Trifolium repens]
MDTRAEKDMKFNIAFTTLSDLEKGQKLDAELARHLMTKMEKSGAKRNAKTKKPPIIKYTFVKAADLGESSTTQSKRASKRAREADNAQDRPFYKFI